MQNNTFFRPVRPCAVVYIVHNVNTFEVKNTLLCGSSMQVTANELYWNVEMCVIHM